MAITTKPGKASINWRQGFAELSFIPVFSDWIELLASRLAQPLMFVSSLYIIAETTIPGVATWSAWLDLSTRTVMSLAPEIILPGCFLQSQQSQRDGKERKARLLLTLFGFCIFLLGITLASFIWHFSDAINGLILFVRCGVGVTYTVILKIDKGSAVVIAQPVPTTQPTQTLPTPEDLAAQIENAVRKVLNERFAQPVQTPQPPTKIEEIAQPAQQAVIAQHSTAHDEHEDNDEPAHVSQQATIPTLHIVHPEQDDEQPAQLSTREMVFAYIDKHPEALFNNEMIMAALKLKKDTARRYRGEYKVARGGVQ